MKVGGNASANDFFIKHGVSSLLSDVDTKKKYSSRVGELYRQELARRVEDDVARSVSTFPLKYPLFNLPPSFFIRFPNGIVVDGMDAPAAALAKEETEDDFFDSWSKPTTPKSSHPGTPRISTPPIIGRSVSATSTTTNTNTTSPPNSTPTPPPPSPRTLTSSAAARPGRLGGTSRLNSASSGGSITSSTATKKSKLGLGAAKTKPVDFAEAERKAIEEAERIKQLGYDREQEEKEEKARKDREALKKAQELGSRAGIAAATTSVQATTNGSNKSTADPQKSAAFPRLGFGAIPGAGAAAAVAAAPTTTKTKYTIPSFLPHLSCANFLTFAVCHPLRTTRLQLLVTNLETKKGYLRICISDETLTTLMLYVRLKRDFNPSKELLPFLPINTLEGKKKKNDLEVVMREVCWVMVAVLRDWRVRLEMLLREFCRILMFRMWVRRLGRGLLGYVKTCFVLCFVLILC